MRKFGLAFWFYFKGNLTVKAGLLYAMVFVAIVGVGFFIRNFKSPPKKVGLVVEEIERENFNPIFDLDGFECEWIENEDEGKYLLNQKDLDELYTISFNRSENKIHLHVIKESRNSQTSSSMQLMIEKLIQDLAILDVFEKNNISETVLVQLLEPYSVEVEVMKDDFDQNHSNTQLICWLYCYALLTITMFTGSAVAHSIFSEKNSKVTELMMAKINLTFLMNARILSIVINFIMLIGVSLLGLFVNDILAEQNLISFLTTLFDGLPLWQLLVTLLVFIIGYFMYMLLYAMMGALANSLENINQWNLPLLLVISSPFFLLRIADPENIFIKILAYFPLTSPILIVPRSLLGDSTVFEALGSTLILCVFAIFFAFVTSRSFANALTFNKEKLTFNDLKKLILNH